MNQQSKHPKNPPLKLTACAVARMGLPKGFTGRQFDYKDALSQGLYLRIYDTGAKRYIVRYRLHGRRQLLVLGSTDDLGLRAARAAAAEVVALAGDGKDPRAERQSRDEQAQRHVLTFREFALKRYLKGYARLKNRDVKRNERHLEAHIFPAFGDMPIDEITRDQVLDWLEDQRKRAPVGADRVAATLSKVFTLALQQGKIEVHPASRLPKAEGSEGDVVLDEREIAYFWNNTITGEKVHIVTGLALRFALLTGQRASEVANLPRKGELDLVGKLWHLPKTRSKNKRPHVLPLSDLAIETLELAMEKSAHPDYVFSARPGKCLNGSSLAHAMGRLFGHEPGAPRTHDLRRTFASRLSLLGVNPEVRERLLTHRLPQLVRTYDKWDHLPQMRVAVDLWAEHLMELVAAAGEEPPEPDK